MSDLKKRHSADEVLATEWPLSLAVSPSGDEIFEAACPCCAILGVGFDVEVHCWRSGCEHGCHYSGIHVTGALDDDKKRKIAEHIRDNNGWSNHTDWNIVIKP